MISGNDRDRRNNLFRLGSPCVLGNTLHRHHGSLLSGRRTACGSPEILLMKLFLLHFHCATEDWFRSTREKSLGERLSHSEGDWEKRLFFSLLDNWYKKYKKFCRPRETLRRPLMITNTAKSATA